METPLFPKGPSLFSKSLKRPPASFTTIATAIVSRLTGSYCIFKLLDMDADEIFVPIPPAMTHGQAATAADADFRFLGVIRLKIMNGLQS